MDPTDDDHEVRALSCAGPRGLEPSLGTPSRFGGKSNLVDPYAPLLRFVLSRAWPRLAQAGRSRGTACGRVVLVSAEVATSSATPIH